MEEFGDSGIVGGLAEELGHRDIIVFEELRHGSIQVPWDVHLGLVSLILYIVVLKSLSAH